MTGQDRNREVNSRLGGRPQAGQGRGQGQGQGQGFPKPRTNLRTNTPVAPGSNFRNFGKESDTRRRREEGRAYGASYHDQDDDGDDFDQEHSIGGMAFSSTQHDHDDDPEEDDRRVMMGRRDYAFGGDDEDDGDVA